MILDLNDFFDLIRVEMNDAIKGLIDQKLNKLFNHAADPEKYDPAFTKTQNKLRYILHVATIMHGQMLEEAYLCALREKLQRCEVWEDKSFKVSNDALQITTQLNDQRVLETFLPYGECAKIGKKNKTNQVDIIIYDKDKKNITAYEVKRGGSPHDRQKKEKLLGDLIATHVLLKDYGKQKGLEINKSSAFIISHLGTDLVNPNWRHLQINGDEVDSHFETDISTETKKAEEYWLKIFNENYKELAN
tara:strand:+ start:308 stop:1048 length:741 start_codon:yes stop_codon:yes gene_type:complete